MKNKKYMISGVPLQDGREGPWLLLNLLLLLSLSLSIEAQVPSPPSWQCILEYSFPIRRNNNGFIECMTLDGKSCLSSTPCSKSLSLISVGSLTCGDNLKSVSSVTGYDDPSHWCFRANQYLPYPCQQASNSSNSKSSYCSVIISESSLLPGDPFRFLELANRGPNDIPLDNWKLTNSPTASPSSSFPLTNLTIPKFGFLVIPSSIIGLYSFSTFRFIFLMGPPDDNGNLTVVHSFYVGQNMAFFYGSFELPDKAMSIQLMKYPTPGNANYYPLVGPLVFKEVMFSQCVYGTYVVIQYLQHSNYNGMFTGLSLRLEYTENDQLKTFSYEIVNSTTAVNLILPLVVYNKDIADLSNVIDTTKYTPFGIRSFKIPSLDRTVVNPRNYTFTLRLMWNWIIMDTFIFDPNYYDLWACDSIKKISPLLVSVTPTSWIVGKAFDFGVIKCDSTLNNCPVSECITSNCGSGVCSSSFKSEYTYCGNTIQTFANSLTSPIQSRFGYVTDMFYQSYLNGDKSIVVEPPMTNSFHLTFLAFSGLQLYIYNETQLVYTLNSSFPAQSIHEMDVLGSRLTLKTKVSGSTVGTGFVLYYDTVNSCNGGSSRCEQGCTITKSGNNSVLSCICDFGYQLADVSTGFCINKPQLGGYARIIDYKNFCGFMNIPSLTPYKLLGNAVNNAGSSYIGCISSTLLSKYKSTSESKQMDLSKCSYECSLNTYFGVMNGTVCICFDTLPTAQFRQDCLISCPGDMRETCGGATSFSVWRHSSSCAISLTPALSSRMGAVWFMEPIDISKDFVIQFDFQALLDNGADGLVFIMEDDKVPDESLLSGTGGLLGYDWATSVIALEFDTYHNRWDDGEDPASGRHISLQTKLKTAPIVYNDSFPFDNTAIHRVTIQYTNSITSLRVSIDSVLLFDLNYTLSQVLSSSSIYVGFSSATGGLTNSYMIGSLLVDSLCPSGFRVEGRSCADINECLIAGVCDQLCNNTVGSFNCYCKPGYEIERGTGKCYSICGDSFVTANEECDSGNGCSNCTCKAGWLSEKKPDCKDIDECARDPCPSYSSCINSPGSFACKCDIGYHEDNKSCIANACVYTSWGRWSACSRENCENKQNRTREVNNTASAGSPQCNSYASLLALIEERICIYSCVYTGDDAESASNYLFSDWKTRGRLEELFLQNSIDLTIRNIQQTKNVITVSLTGRSTKRNLANCSSSDIKTAANIILNDTKSTLTRILPQRIQMNVNPLDSACNVQLTINPDVLFPMFEVLISIIGGLVLVGIVISLLCWYRQINRLRVIPNELSWPFVSAEKDIFGITWKRTTAGGLCYSKKLRKSSSQYEAVAKLLTQSLGGQDDFYSTIWAVYNKALVIRFYKEYMVWEERVKAKIFQKKNWRLTAGSDEREWVYAQFEKRLKHFPWNTENTHPILPVVHGTTLDKAFKICNTGFAILQTLDSGFYGKGIYVTSYSIYALLYAIGKDPALIVAYVQPGNPYPVIEHPTGDSSLQGQAIATGYQCHYVRVNLRGGSGFPAVYKEDSVDEIVIGQESFIVPAFIVKIKPQMVAEAVKQEAFDKRTASLELSREKQPRHKHNQLQDSQKEGPGSGPGPIEGEEGRLVIDQSDSRYFVLQ